MNSHFSSRNVPQQYEKARNRIYLLLIKNCQFLGTSAPDTECLNHCRVPAKSKITLLISVFISIFDYIDYILRYQSTINMFIVLHVGNSYRYIFNIHSLHRLSFAFFFMHIFYRSTCLLIALTMSIRLTCFAKSQSFYLRSTWTRTL